MRSSFYYYVIPSISNTSLIFIYALQVSIVGFLDPFFLKEATVKGHTPPPYVAMQAPPKGKRKLESRYSLKPAKLTKSVGQVKADTW